MHGVSHAEWAVLRPRFLADPSPGSPGSSGEVGPRGEVARPRCVWVDKIQMDNACLHAISSASSTSSGSGQFRVVVLQMDSDELWSPRSIAAAYALLSPPTPGPHHRDAGGDDGGEAKGEAKGEGGGSADARAGAARARGFGCLRVHCHFFVAPGLVTVTRGGYGHSDGYEWTRAWGVGAGDT